jgi:hypothetical protein
LGGDLDDGAALETAVKEHGGVPFVVVDVPAVAHVAVEVNLVDRHGGEGRAHQVEQLAARDPGLADGVAQPLGMLGVALAQDVPGPTPRALELPLLN